MFSTLRKRISTKRREPFGKAGLTVAVCALVLGLVGGAYAAGGLTKSQEKQVTKIAKRYAGKPGATGPAGAAGATGSTGPAGAAGKNGTNGKDGTNGTNGSPWTAGGTLPKGSTETGSWSASGIAMGGAFGSHAVLTSISFLVPLAQPLANSSFACDQPGEPLCVVHVIRSAEHQKLEAGEIGAAAGELCEGLSLTELTECEKGFEKLAELCPGDVASPEAAKGNLCVYGSGTDQNVGNIIPAKTGTPGDGLGASTAGSLLVVVPPGASLPEIEAEPVSISGTWAVTAE